MGSRTGVHTQENVFKNISIGTLVKFANNSTILMVTDRQQEVYGGVLAETVLYCSNGSYIRKVGHMDKEAPTLEIVEITNDLMYMLTNRRMMTIMLD